MTTLIHNYVRIVPSMIEIFTFLIRDEISSNAVFGILKLSSTEQSFPHNYVKNFFHLWCLGLRCACQRGYWGRAERYS